MNEQLQAKRRNRPSEPEQRGSRRCRTPVGEPTRPQLTRLTLIGERITELLRMARNGREVPSS